MGWFSDMFKGEEDEIIKTSTLSAQQQKVFDSVGDWLYKSVGEGSSAWPGSFAAKASEQEEAGLAKLTEYVGGEMGEVGTEGLGAYLESLKGLSPEYMTSMFRETVQPELRKTMREETIPGIRESYVGSGTFYGGSRTDKEKEAWGDYQTDVAQGIGGYVMKGQEFGRESLSMLPGMTALQDEDPYRRARAGLEYGALPRQIEQKELEGKIADYIRTLPENSPMIPYLMNYLDKSTQAYHVQEGGPSPFSQVADLASSIASMFTPMPTIGGGYNSAPEVD